MSFPPSQWPTSLSVWLNFEMSRVHFLKFLLVSISLEGFFEFWAKAFSSSSIRANKMTFFFFFFTFSTMAIGPQEWRNLSVLFLSLSIFFFLKARRTKTPDMKKQADRRTRREQKLKGLPAIFFCLQLRQGRRVKDR